MTPLPDFHSPRHIDISTCACASRSPYFTFLSACKSVVSTAAFRFIIRSPNLFSYLEHGEATIFHQRSLLQLRMNRVLFAAKHI